MEKEKIINELISTIENNAVDNVTTISNVKLWAESWRKELSEVKESVTDEEIEERFPYARSLTDYGAQIGAKWLRSRLQPAQSPITDEQIEKWAELQTVGLFTEPFKDGYKKGIVAGADAIQSGQIAEWLKQNPQE